MAMPATTKRWTLEEVHSGQKRDFYMEVGVPEYWFIDRQYRSLRVVRRGVEDVTVSDSYWWQPAGASEPLDVDVQPLFG